MRVERLVAERVTAETGRGQKYPFRAHRTGGDRPRQQRQDIIRRSVEIAMLFLRTVDVTAAALFTPEDVLSDPQECSDRHRRSPVYALVIDVGPVRRPEVLDDDGAVDDAQEAVQTRDIAIGQNDIDMMIAPDRFRALRHLDASSSLAAFEHDQRQCEVVDGYARLGDSLTRYGGCGSRRQALEYGFQVFQ